MTIEDNPIRDSFTVEEKELPKVLYPSSPKQSNIIDQLQATTLEDHHSITADVNIQHLERQSIQSDVVYSTPPVMYENQRRNSDMNPRPMYPPHGMRPVLVPYGRPLPQPPQGFRPPMNMVMPDGRILRPLPMPMHGTMPGRMPVRMTPYPPPPGGIPQFDSLGRPVVMQGSPPPPMPQRPPQQMPHALQFPRPLLRQMDSLGRPIVFVQNQGMRPFPPHMRPMMIPVRMQNGVPVPMQGWRPMPVNAMYNDSNQNSSTPVLPVGEYRRSFEPPDSASLDRNSLDEKTLSRPGSQSPIPDSNSDSFSDLVPLPIDEQAGQTPPSFATLKKRKSKPSILVGEGASVVPFEKTLEMYRENAKKTTDPKVLFEFAKVCIQAGDSHTEEGFNVLKRVASSGYPEAQHTLGQAYQDDGRFELAYGQYLLAAKKSYAPSCHAVAECAEKGQGCRKNARLALDMYTKAATAGYKPSMLRLGLAEMNGELHLKPDILKAVKWFKRGAAVADKDHVQPLFELVKIYENGHPPLIQPDVNYAQSLLVEAAGLDYAPALVQLGYCHEYGLLGCEVNPVTFF